ncbi:MAG: toll/interleukin-1 receptor domain-containing protein [Oscillospiraceae bacterium]|nr:toll/interleukin-1 receptor domain-containing protein [Oscillospiraceae bacterium]
MILEDTHYDAFISYRHTEPDMFAAQTLHKELEAFRLPRNLIKKLQPGDAVKTRIRRVFRDQDELPISCDLKEPILHALQNSDFLIVICTPRLPQSLWCRTEIEQFIAMHGRERVLAVLAEGEPEESFPEQLRYIEQDGQRKEVEPLAADIRAANRKEMRKKIRLETLRLAAPMFGCGYDDLRQRHRERRLRRMAAVGAAVAAVCFVFGAVSTVMAMRIGAQSKQIADQKSQIEAQYTQALKANAETQAAEALRILETGDRLTAVKTALAVMPGPENEEQPYTAKAQYALTQSLGVYESGVRVLPKHTLNHEAALSFMTVSPGGTRLLTGDGYGKLYVWDALEGTLLFETDDLFKINLSPSTAGFLDEDRIYYPVSTGLGVYDLSARQEDAIDLGGSYESARMNGGHSSLIVTNAARAIVFNAEDLLPRRVFLLPENTGWDTDAVLDERGERAAVLWKTSSDFFEETTHINIFHVDTGELFAAYTLEGENAEQLTFSGDDLLLTAFARSSDMTYTQELRCYDTQSENLRWSQRKTSLDFFIPFAFEESRLVLAASYDKLTVLRQDTGETLGQILYPAAVVGVFPEENERYAGVRLRNGEYHYLNFSDMSDLNMSGANGFKAVPENLQQAVMGNGYLASYDHNATDVVIHATAAGSRAEVLMETDGYLKNMLVKNDESAVLLVNSSSLTALDPVKNEVLFQQQMDEPIVAAAYLGDAQEEIAVAFPHSLALLDAATGEIKDARQLEGTDLTVLQFSQDGAQFALVQPWEISVYDTRTGELLTQDGRLSQLTAGACAVSEDLSLYAAACPDQKELQIFHLGGEKMVLSIPLNAACVQYVALCKDANRLYVTYLDGKAEAYSLSKGTLLKTYTSLPFELRQARRIPGGAVLLAGPEGACVTDQQGELLALLDAPCAALTKSGLYLTAGNGRLLSFPIYDASMLRKEAQALLDKTERTAP